MDLIVIAGPTACGKTDAAIELALRVNGEIISADSMQVYKYMDVGTAKISKDKMQGIRHHLIDIMYPDEEFSVALFKDLAKASINDIKSRQKIPILVGGTGFYINALVYDTDFDTKKNSLSYREELYEKAEDKKALYNMLKEIDPEATLYIHENNIKKVVRALEYYKETGNKISEHNKQQQLRKEAYDTRFFILNRNRKRLHESIEKRVDHMMEAGLEEEVRDILSRGYKRDLISMSGIGYKEIISYIEGEIGLEEAVELLKRNTRRFAKRQITWFKNKTDGSGIWIDTDEHNTAEKIADEIINLLEIKK